MYGKSALSYVSVAAENLINKLNSVAYIYTAGELYLRYK
jgi:hypothetical protein